ncbi:MAG: Rossmann-like domain-containing protein, partial [Actinomycetota bacterium]
LEEVLDHTAAAREVVLLGPSTPYVPSAFRATPVTLLAGSKVSNPARVRQVVSEGGGTMTMGKALGKWTARVR